MNTLEKSTNYYGAIDGLRAFSFLIVFLFHTQIQGFQLGWGGVTVFFVISGFLITEILVRNKNSNSFFKNFYIRRALRIFPIYYLVLFGATLIYFLLNDSFPKDFIFQFTYTQNILWVFTEYSSDLQTLLAHTWTLAIEEQFYLVWPLLIFLVPTKHLPKLCVGLIIFAFAFRIATIHFGLNTYVTSILLFSQIDTMALGALLIFYKNKVIKGKVITFLFKNSIPIGILGIISIIGYIGFIEKVNMFTAYDLLKTSKGYTGNMYTAQIFFFISLLTTGLIQICYSDKKTILKKVFENSFLTHLGKISYGMYLYHWPILVVLNNIFSNSMIIAISAFGITYLVSVISYTTYEKYFIGLKDKFVYSKKPSTKVVKGPI